MARPMTERLTRKPGLRSRQKTERQADILNAAIYVMAEKGYHKTRISDIAEHAGVAYGLVYHYFGSKEKILAYILESLWERFGERISKIQNSGQSTASKLTEIMDYMLDTQIARPDIIRLLVQEIVRARNIENLPEMEIVRRIIGMIEQVFIDGVAAGELEAGTDTRLLALTFFGSVELLLTAVATGVYNPGKKLDTRQLKHLKKQMRAFIHGGSFGVSPEAKS